MKKYSDAMDLTSAEITVELEEKLGLSEIWDMEYECWFENDRFVDAVVSFFKERPSDMAHWITAMSRISDEFTGSFVELSDLKMWGNLGVNIDDILGLYFERDGASAMTMELINGNVCWGYVATEGFPEWLTLDRFLKFVPMEQIISSCAYGFDEFLESYLAAGGDLHALAEKFISEIGYSDQYKSFDAMLCMISRDPSLFNLTAYAEKVDCNQLMDNNEREYYYCNLAEAGLNEKYLKKFSA